MRTLLRNSSKSMPRYSSHYLDQLLDQRDYAALVDLQAIATGWEGFDPGAPSFGCPRPVFAVFEMLTWLAQAVRSGVWTYYEATPPDRAECMLEALDALDAATLRQKYAQGRAHWRDAEACAELDDWIGDHEPALVAWAFGVLEAHRADLALVGT